MHVNKQKAVPALMIEEGPVCSTMCHHQHFVACVEDQTTFDATPMKIYPLGHTKFNRTFI